MYSADDSIVAIATPPGRGGVGIVRLSGANGILIASKITHQTEFKIRHAHFLKCFNEIEEVVDEGVILYFKGPHSYTGEDVIEFQMHGSPWVLAELIRLCQLYGARVARAGEFTERAFLNNKIDLVQAEAVADLIAAQSATAAKMATRTLQGTFSDYVHAIDADLTSLRMFVESTIDFSDEALEWLEQHQWQKRLEDILKRIYKLKKQAHQGQIMQEGLHIVLAGRPNAGKSTLMNALVEKDVAIVTDIAGTTRDVMREQVLLDDIPVTLIDTAGLRESEDIVEQEGIKRAWQAMSHADVVLFLHDVTQKGWEKDNLPKDVLEHIPQDTPIIHVLNKIDKEMNLSIDAPATVGISAKTGFGMDALKALIKQYVGIEQEENDFIARRRHLLIFDALEQLIVEAIDHFNLHHAPELLAEDLKYAHEKLAAITGEFSADDLLGEIFSHFCIGK